MPLYFFTVAAEGQEPEDLEDAVLDGPQQARAKLVVLTAALLLRDTDRAFWPTPVWHLTVTDETGARIAWLSIMGQEGTGGER